MPSEQVSSSSSWGWGGLKDPNLAIADIQNSAEGNNLDESIGLSRDLNPGLPLDHWAAMILWF